MNPNPEKTIYSIEEAELQLIQQLIEDCQCSEEQKLRMEIMFILINIARSHQDIGVMTLATLKNQSIKQNLSTKEALKVAIITLVVVAVLGVRSTILSSFTI